MPEMSFVWNGEQVSQAVVEACMEAMNELAPVGEAYLRDLTPVRTGFLRDSSYVIVEASGGPDGATPVMIFGQSAEYALFVELGTRFMDGHYQVTQTAMFIFPQLPERIAMALGQAGYGTATIRGVSAGPGEPNPYISGPLESLLGAALAEAPLNP